jgi:2-keto-4-pentenoate hydratase/2-oxohepta-3-ene-1,7-dioic acid hydratase in catechol pathway
MKIFAVGMNYFQHNKELDGALDKPEEPVIFTKADSALLKDHKPFFVPDWSARVDYEAELVVRICRLGKGIPERFARRYYDAVTVGIDFTARDMQQRARSHGLPWTICKGFDGSAVIGEWMELGLGDYVGEARTIGELCFRLDVNGHTVQQGRAADMLYSVDEIIAYISRFFTLKTGDLIYTGTPAGVGPVSIGDHLEGWIDATGGKDQPRRVLDFFAR